MTDAPAPQPVVLTPDEQEKYKQFLAARDAEQPTETSEPEPQEDTGPPMYPDVMNGRPRFLIVESNLHVQTSKEGELVLPLDIPTKVFRQIGGEQEELDQLFSILDALGDQDASDKLANLGILETMGIVTRFFEEFSKKAQATMGEASRSSR